MEEKISLALALTILVALGGMIYRAGILSHNVEALSAEVAALRVRVDRLDLIAATANERWRNLGKEPYP